MSASEVDVRELVERLQLEPLLPEGGFFRRTHYSSTEVQGPDGRGRALNAIFYLMLRDNVSKLHRLRVDETWHFYHGASVTIVELDESVQGQLRTTRLGSVVSGLCPQYTVNAGTWFGAYPEGSFSLVGCTCGPAFEFEHFELGDASLLEKYPEAEEQIKRLL
ncbi:unnamed protein product [Effrenium voratum]|uniref:DUF985 domain-containing protein n=1 Tax=Effrenium voratum TaxID=2562239 RepID=A0AA36MJ37_9DINO|nr:unnamed protein product [Effrenium voratum]CAJ1458032.1 unnamed protein product [Effrenium voratum]